MCSALLAELACICLILDSYKCSCCLYRARLQRRFLAVGLSTKVKQMTVYELSKLLPEKFRPLPLELVRINDTRSDIVPNSGLCFPAASIGATTTYTSLMSHFLDVACP